jgi:hypothetical protein
LHHLPVLVSAIVVLHPYLSTPWFDYVYGRKEMDV